MIRNPGSIRSSIVSKIAPLTVAIFLPSLVFGNHIDFISDDSNPANGITNATFSLSSSNSTVVTSTQVGDPADILGGTRVVSLSRNGGFGQSITAEKVAGTDFISVENGNVAAGTLVLSYPDIGGSNFSSMWDAISVNIPFLDQLSGIGDGEINLSVSISDGLSMATVFADGTGLAPGRIEEAGIYNFMFSDFLGIDFTSISTVAVMFETAIIGSDFRIGSITRELLNPPQGVPAPAPLGLLALGLAGLLRARKRRA